MFFSMHANLAEELKLPYLSAYLDSIGSNYNYGANFAAGGSSIRPTGFSPVFFGLQISQFTQFKSRTMALFQKQASQVHGLLQCPIHHRYWSERSKLWFHVLRSTICQINNPWYIEPILSRITSKQPGFLVLLIFHLYLNSIWTIFYKHLKEKKKKVLNLKLAYAWVTFNNSSFNFKLTK